MAVEEACFKLPPKVTEKLRAETSYILKHDCPLKPNISGEEAGALKELKQNKSRVKLTVGKGW